LGRGCAADVVNADPKGQGIPVSRFFGEVLTDSVSHLQVPGPRYERRNFN
jgi:hypothetical protein